MHTDRVSTEGRKGNNPRSKLFLCKEDVVCMSKTLEMYLYRVRVLVTGA